MTFVDRYGKCAIVAGASTGLGAAFARELAARGLDLLLLARRGDVLATLAAEIRAAHPVGVRVAAVDLGGANLLAEVRAAAAGLDVGLVVYNAAHSLIGPFLSQPLEEKLRIVDVNCRGPLVFADEFGRSMAARKGRRSSPPTRRPRRSTSCSPKDCGTSSGSKASTCLPAAPAPRARPTTKRRSRTAGCR
ncbi:MAG TPA: SDR family NAD(P)-dependent oxidoreductase [Polyangia bacterium]